MSIQNETPTLAQLEERETVMDNVILRSPVRARQVGLCLFIFMCTGNAFFFFKSSKEAPGGFGGCAYLCASPTKLT